MREDEPEELELLRDDEVETDVRVEDCLDDADSRLMVVVFPEASVVLTVVRVVPDLLTRLSTVVEGVTDLVVERTEVPVLSEREFAFVLSEREEDVALPERDDWEDVCDFEDLTDEEAVLVEEVFPVERTEPEVPVVAVVLPVLRVEVVVVEAEREEVVLVPSLVCCC